MKYSRRVEYINNGIDFIDNNSRDWSRSELEDLLREAVIMLHEERTSKLGEAELPASDNTAMLPCDNKSCHAWDCGVCSSYLAEKCDARQQ